MLDKKLNWKNMVTADLLLTYQTKGEERARAQVLSNLKELKDVSKNIHLTYKTIGGLEKGLKAELQAFAKETAGLFTAEQSSIGKEAISAGFKKEMEAARKELTALHVKKDALVASVVKEIKSFSLKTVGDLADAKALVEAEAKKKGGNVSLRKELAKYSKEIKEELTSIKNQKVDTTTIKNEKEERTSEKSRNEKRKEFVVKNK
jgi:hypothetical protein